MHTGSCKTLAYLILIFELMGFDLNNYAKDLQILGILRELKREYETLMGNVSDMGHVSE